MWKTRENLLNALEELEGTIHAGSLRSPSDYFCHAEINEVVDEVWPEYEKQKVAHDMWFAKAHELEEQLNVKQAIIDEFVKACDEFVMAWTRHAMTGELVHVKPFLALLAIAAKRAGDRG